MTVKKSQVGDAAGAAYRGTKMSSSLPGKSSASTTVGLTKVALRLLHLGDVADAVGDLTGLGRANIESFVRSSEKDLLNRPSAEFETVATADREWVEGVIRRAYIALVNNPNHAVMGESLVGPEAVVHLAHEAMSADDRREIEKASEDVRAYLRAVSESIAYLICGWYVTNVDANRAAMSKATGETLKIVRTFPHQVEDLKAHLDSTFAPVLERLERAMSEARPSIGIEQEQEPEPEQERLTFEVDFSFVPLAEDPVITELVSAAVVASLNNRPVKIEVLLPSLDEDVKQFGDAVLEAQIKRGRKDSALRLQLVLEAFFSRHVETAWADYFDGVPDRVKVVRAIFAGQKPVGAKLDVWRTTPPLASAPIWLTPEEIQATVESTGLGHWDHLRGGAGWRAADELPRSIIVEKVFASILAELVRRGVTTEENWGPEVLALPLWHIGQG